MKLRDSRPALTRQQELILDYWISLCAEGQLPTRRQINPARLGTALASTSLVQKEETGFRYRLTGSRLKGLFGNDGEKSLLAVIDDNISEAGSESLELTLEMGRPVTGSRRVGARWHCWLRLPFLDEDGQRSLVLCVDEFPASFDAGPSETRDEELAERFVA